MAYSGGQEEKMSVLTLRPESMLMSQGQGLQATYPDTSETSEFLPTPYRTNLHRQEYMRWLRVFTAITWYYSSCDSSDSALTPRRSNIPQDPTLMLTSWASPSGFAAFKGCTQTLWHTSDPTARAPGTDYDFQDGTSVRSYIQSLCTQLWVARLNGQAATTTTRKESCSAEPMVSLCHPQYSVPRVRCHLPPLPLDLWCPWV